MSALRSLGVNDSNTTEPTPFDFDGRGSHQRAAVDLGAYEHF